jgi:hypothetical protein
MNKISNEMAYNLIFNRGLLPPGDREYEDDRMKQAVTELNEIREVERKVCKIISSLYPIKYKLFLYTDDDYCIDIKDKRITDEGCVYFTSIDDIENSIKDAKITPDDGFMRDILNQALESIKNGEDFSFSGNQTVELTRV